MLFGGLLRTWMFPNGVQLSWIFSCAIIRAFRPLGGVGAFVTRAFRIQLCRLLFAIFFKLFFIKIRKFLTFPTRCPTLAASLALSCLCACSLTQIFWYLCSSRSKMGVEGRVGTPNIISNFGSKFRKTKECPFLLDLCLCFEIENLIFEPNQGCFAPGSLSVACWWRACRGCFGTLWEVRNFQIYNLIKIFGQSEARDRLFRFFSNPDFICSRSVTSPARTASRFKATKSFSNLIRAFFFMF